MRPANGWIKRVAVFVVLTVNAGPRLRVGDVRVVGAMPLERTAVTSSAGLAQGEPYRRRATEDALRDVADRLRSLRYYEASVSHFATPVEVFNAKLGQCWCFVLVLALVDCPAEVSSDGLFAVYSTRYLFSVGGHY